jgi:transposase
MPVLLAVKPFVIGRKNWLFSQTANFAHARAKLYSIVETAKANGLMPFDYVMSGLDELCQSELCIDNLLPWDFKKRCCFLDCYTTKKTRCYALQI